MLDAAMVLFLVQTPAGGVLASMPDEVLADAAGLAARVGVEVGDGATVLLALTGRRASPEGFCVL